MKTSLRFRILAGLGGVGIVVASSACAVDSTTPSPPPAATPERTSSFVPSAASKALIGVTDGIYSFTINPKENNVLNLGPNRLEIPGWSICNIGTSGYGPEYWNRSCTPQTRMVTISVTVKGANTSTPSIDFQPAMRFNPATRVSLFFYVPQVSQADARAWTILYCGVGATTTNRCTNEALLDPDLQTYVDYGANVLFRRIKHFSAYRVVDDGYTVSE